MTYTYIALTIGPIYKTLQSVQSTKAIWAASYMFSYLVKEIIKSFKDKPFLMPYVQDNTYFNKTFGVGLFPDRFIFIGDEKDYQELENKINNITKHFSAKAATDLSNTKKYKGTHYTAETLEALLIQYLKVYIPKTDIDDSPDNNPMLRVNDYLDNLELQDNYLPKEDFPFFKDFFENVYYNFLVEEGYGTNEKIKFPTTVEIGTAPLHKINNAAYETAQKILRKAEWEKLSGKSRPDATEAQQAFLKQLNTDFGDQIRFHHKYIAVVQADGDNMGAFIQKLFENDNKQDSTKIEIRDRFTVFSRQLMEFSLASVKLVKAYGGTPVYAGGDDLLFFAPVAISNQDFTVMDNNETSPINNLIKEFDGAKTEVKEPRTKSIFWLISKIDLLFKHFILEHEELIPIIAKTDKKPSMSYGIAISYYKFPLNEALAQGANQLFNTAKKAGNKNAVSWSVLKHSGQFFGTTFTKNTDTFEQFQSMLNINLGGNSSFIASLMYKLESQKHVLEHVAGEEASLDAFFDNNFNEAIHLREKGNYLDDVKTLVKKVFEEEPAHSLDEKIKRIYGALRFIHFLLAKYNEND